MLSPLALSLTLRIGRVLGPKPCPLTLLSHAPRSYEGALSLTWQLILGVHSFNDQKISTTLLYLLENEANSISTWSI